MPAYFELIRERAERRWAQLEQDSELAGPWHQLFKQVQSPRHILSELLQNADDVGATEASVRIENRSFIFNHNGEDFVKDHFASLCRFAYSNKRALHTIGFRGIGFKSTFSLGDKVELYTPSLSVAFYRQRFTEPKWLEYPLRKDGRTEIRVVISDKHRQNEVEKNLQDWLKSPVSLLFFKHIRSLQIGDHEVHWDCVERPGPVPNSEWMALRGKENTPFLHVRSSEEPFPPEAMSEIIQERMITNQDVVSFPPCEVEIVVASKGRLYVVLPTGVETSLSFACNAPFIQDPARMKIKDPETSPTNRWLLERVGKLAATVMMQWLNKSAFDQAQRARAYSLFPDVDRDDNSLEGVCASIVEKIFEAEMVDKAYLLSHEGVLTLANQSVAIPEELFSVWSADQVAGILDEPRRPALSRHISYADKKKLLHWGVIEEIDKSRVLSILQSKRLPEPANWRSLLNLWAYIAPEVTGYRYPGLREKLCIVPVQGKDVLYSASEIVRFGEKKLLQADTDWQFLSSHLLVLNQNWIRYLAEQRRNAEEKKDEKLEEYINAAYKILEDIGLKDASDVSKVIERVAASFFSPSKPALSDCVRIAQIAAKLGATIGSGFRFVTQDGHLRTSEEVVVFDKDGTLSGLFLESWCSKHFLHSDYSKSFDACTSDEWKRWVLSGRSRFFGFAPLSQKQVQLSGQKNIKAELIRRGNEQLDAANIYLQLLISDWDFDDCHWEHWDALAQEDQKIWGIVTQHILEQPQQFWSQAKASKATLVPRDGRRRNYNIPSLIPGWILRLRDLPCLKDTRGFYHKPAELLRRTPETESLIDVELFIHGSLDTESTRPLLKFLGVRDVPTGPDRLIDCLRALAKADKPPIHEVEKWYRRLDQMVDMCSTADFDKVKQSFHNEKIILTENAGWSRASGVFLLAGEEDVPGVAVVRSSVKDLTFWRKIGVSERPTAELAIRWLKEIPSDQAVSKEVGQRIRALFPRYAVRIWDECGHWLNLAGEWVPVSTLKYALTMQSLIPWQHLHPWVKQQTADLQHLTSEIIQTQPFSGLPILATHIEDRFHRNPHTKGHLKRVPWITQMGSELCRIILDSESETSRIRKLAEDFANTSWQTTPGLEIIPYIDEKPAGTPKRTDVVWLNKILYVNDLPYAKAACLVPDKLGKIFNRAEITSAFSYCVNRSPEDITAYLKENFNLAPHEEIKRHLEEEEPPIPPQGQSLDCEKDEVDEKYDLGEIEENEVEGEKDSKEEHIEKPPKGHHPKPPKVHIIERFARNLGYRKDGDNRFINADGSIIVKTTGHRFPWEKLSASGDIICYYLPKDHCLEYEPLQIEYDIWGLLEKYPEKYFLVLSTPEGKPVELSGARLLAMRDEGSIVICPATYRLVYGRQ